MPRQDKQSISPHSPSPSDKNAAYSEKAQRKKLISLTCIMAAVFVLVTTLVTILIPNSAADHPLTSQPTILHQSSPLQISEYMSSNSAYPDEQGNFYDWVELHNSGKSPIDLTGWALCDDKNTCLLPSRTLEPDAYLVVFCTGKSTQVKEGYLPLSLRAAGGESLSLKNAAGEVVDSMVTIPLETSSSAIRGENTFTSTTKFTPGLPNTEEGWTAFQASRTSPTQELVINEVMADNRVTLPDGDNVYPDYIEVLNPSDRPVNLKNYGLTNDEAQPLKFQFPDKVLQPGETILVFASGKGHSQDKTELHAGFKISKASDMVYLYSPAGLLLDKVEINGLASDCALVRDSNGGFVQTSAPSPGFPNTEEGIKAYMATLDEKRPSPIVISEAMSRNTKYAQKLAGKAHDWIELHNRSDKAVSLTGYTLTNDTSQPALFALPDVTIPAGGYLVVYATGGTVVSGDKYIQTNFKLNGEDAVAALFAPDGVMADGISLPNLPTDTSRGRPDGAAGYRYFNTPTPGTANKGDGALTITPTPATTAAAGVYNSHTPVKVGLAGEGTIYYTLDGSDPTTSSLIYREPLSLDKTTVIRALAVDGDSLPSRVMTASYIINENHTMDVVSLVSDPDNLFSYERGIYALGSGNPNTPFLDGANFWKDWERPAHVEFFSEGEDGFSLDCGVKIFGGMSRMYEKKSLSLKFRDCYGAGELDYKVFDNRDFTYYNSLILRTSGQERLRTMFKDAMTTSLMDDAGLVEVQAYRPVVVYINGAYWGVHNIREKIDEHFIATHQNVSPASVEVLQGNGKASEAYQALISYAASHSAADPAVYAYLSEQIDLANYCDYLIAEIYCANNDAGNIRFYRSSEMDGKWRWILYDTDLGFAGNSADRIWYNIKPGGTGAGGNFSTTLINCLLKSSDFRQLFIERLTYNMHHTWNTEKVLQRIEDFYNTYKPEASRNFQRWNPGSLVWENEVQALRNFAKNRHAMIKKELGDNRVGAIFGLSQAEIDACFP